MWYVNLKVGNVIADGFIGFILTMWYVNCFNPPYTITFAFSFILTMWYVNEEAKLLKECLEKAFYINYVVCK